MSADLSPMGSQSDASADPQPPASSPARAACQENGRETWDKIGCVVRMLRAVGRDFAEGRIDTTALELVKQVRAEYDALLDVAVPALRESGYSDREIGDGLGMRRQSVWERWPRETGGTSG